MAVCVHPDLMYIIITGKTHKIHYSSLFTDRLFGISGRTKEILVIPNSLYIKILCTCTSIVMFLYRVSTWIVSDIHPHHFSLIE
jgi:hypothetical protein